MAPKVSVIVPIYNAEKTLFKALDSLMQQSLQEMEFILIDDGSSDKSSDFCHIIVAEDNRFRFFQQKNAGVAVARNLGLKNASGEYIGFLDSDDEAKPEMYKLLLDAIVAQKADMVMGGYEKICDEEITSIVTLPYNGCKSGDDVEEIAWSMAFWNGMKNGKRLSTLYGSTWPNLYRREIINRNAIRFPEGITIGEDLIFNLRYLKSISSVAFINQSLYRYNLGNSSATRRRNPHLLEKYLEILEYIGQILFEPNNADLQRNLYRQTISYAISVIEEQGPLLHSKIEKNELIRNICKNEIVHNAATKLLTTSPNIKEFVQALLFFSKCHSILNHWLIG